jgi:hypothetical protein
MILIEVINNESERSDFRREYVYTYTVKPVHAVTSIKQLPVIKFTFFLSCHRKFHMN